MENFYYTLGLLLSKGKIVTSKSSKTIDLIFEIRFNKPTDQSTRSDNITNKINIQTKPINMYNYLLPDIIKIWNLLSEVFENNKVELEYIPEPKNNEDFSRKTVRWIVRGIRKDDYFIKSFWENETLNLPTDLDKVPKKIQELQDRAMKKELAIDDIEYIRNFLIGIVDASTVIPGPESSSFGGSGKPRLQIESDTGRWKIHVPLVVFFQEVFEIPIENINWPHPTIKSRKKPKVSLRHNHQFRPNMWHFFSKLEFHLSVKQRNLESYIESVDDKFKKNLVGKDDFYPNVYKKSIKTYVDKSTFLANYPEKAARYTTEPFHCSDHEEDSEQLPIEVRNKHYGYYWDILQDLGDPYLDDYISNLLKSR